MDADEGTSHQRRFQSPNNESKGPVQSRVFPGADPCEWRPSVVFCRQPYGFEAERRRCIEKERQKFSQKL